MDQNVKTCSTCKVEKLANTENFGRAKLGKYGLRAVCKPCASKATSDKYYANHEENKRKSREKSSSPERKQYMAEYYKKNQEDLKEKSREFYSKDKEPYLRRSKESRENNPLGTARYMKEYREANIERLSANQKDRYEENKEQILTNNKIYRTKNRTILNAKRCYKIKHDLNCKMRYNVKKSLTRALKEYNGKKANKTMSYHGCTIQELISHVESTWQSGMSWENYGTYWEIDHIKPIAMFNFEEQSEIYRCFNYKNLQALTREENLSKCDNIYGINGRELRIMKQASIIAPKLNMGYAATPFDFMIDF